MDPWFRLIENSSLSTWLRESPSLLAFPAVLTAHTMAILTCNSVQNTALIANCICRAG